MPVPCRCSGIDDLPPSLPGGVLPVMVNFYLIENFLCIPQIQLFLTCFGLLTLAS
jgi:hypothetical protein